MNKAYVYVGIVLGVITILLLLVITGILVVILQPEKNPPTTHAVVPSPLNKRVSGASNLNVPLTNGEPSGAWHFLPHALVEESQKNKDFDYSKSLSRSNYPVILYFPAVGGYRYVDTYSVLRRFFHVITFDYQDSSTSEERLLQDSVQLYKWLRTQTNVDIFFWGHEVGAAVSTLTIAKLQEEEITPTGLFLEAPFTTLKAQLEELEFYKNLKWLQGYEAYIFEHFKNNGFTLNTIDHISLVDCPIMIVHAKDDTITPYDFSMELYNIAREHDTIQGSVTLYLLPEHFQYGHFDIGRAPELPQYIQTHINACKVYSCTLQEGATYSRNDLAYSNGIPSTCAQYLLNLLSED